jgi:phosphoglycolate phosphatase
VTRTYQEISTETAKRLRLIMSDVDGTLTADGEYFSPEIIEIISRLQENGIMVGLVSGRTLSRLIKTAQLLGTRGPLIAENGGVVQLTLEGEILNLGYSRRPAVEAVAKLKAAFPGRISERKDNIFRTVDVTVYTGGISLTELQKAAPGVQISDSGYMVHVMAEGISKGGTLAKILDRITGGPFTRDEVMVCGDSPTDVSLFREFPVSVRIYNPKLSPEQNVAMEGETAYRSTAEIDKGFFQVAEYIIMISRS